MRFIFRALTGLLIMVATAALLVLGARPYLACWPQAQAALGGTCALDRSAGRGGRGGGSGEPVFAARVETIAYGRETPRFIAYGEIRARRSLDLRAASAGRLVDVSESFIDGAPVAAGTTLFAVDPADAESRAADAEAALAEARASLAEAEEGLRFAEAELEAARGQRQLRARALERQRSLSRRGVSAETAVETAELALADAERAVIAGDQARRAAEARVEQGRLSVRRAEIALADARRDAGDTRVVAPFDGVVSIAATTENGGAAPAIGRLVSLNERLGALIDPASLEAAVRVADAEFGRLLDAEGRLIDAEAVVRLTLGERTFEAGSRLVRAAPTSTSDAAGRLVYLALSPPSDAAPAETPFRPGDFVEVEIVEPPLDDVARVPTDALDGADALLVLDREQRLVATRVEIVRRMGDETLVRGVEVGARYVSRRAPQLLDGVRVRPLGEDGTAGESGAAGEGGAEREGGSAGEGARGRGGPRAERGRGERG